MNFQTSACTFNPRYMQNRKIKVGGLMLHSVGCAQPKAQPFINAWNKSSCQAEAHGLIQPDGTVFQTFLFDTRLWHCGGTANNTHIGIEMTEPSTIKYLGGATWKDLNPAATKAHVMGTYNTAVELFADLCKQYSLNPLQKGVIISHHEGHLLGVAADHADVEHIWSKFGLTMDKFRQDVKAKM